MLSTVSRLLRMTSSTFIISISSTNFQEILHLFEPKLFPKWSIIIEISKILIHFLIYNFYINTHDFWFWGEYCKWEKIDVQNFNMLKHKNCPTWICIFEIFALRMLSKAKHVNVRNDQHSKIFIIIYSNFKSLLNCMSYHKFKI